MRIDLQPVHCRLFSLHAHFPAGEPSPDLLATDCGSQFLKRRGTAEGRYSIAGREYGVFARIVRLEKSTLIDVTYGTPRAKLGKTKKPLDVEKLWKCLGKTARLRTWHCSALFEYPKSGYDFKFVLPCPIEKPVEGFSEVRGVRLVRVLEGKVLYSVILDRPENEAVTCSVSFTMEKEKLDSLAGDALGKASEIVGFLVAPQAREDVKP